MRNPQELSESLLTLGEEYSRLGDEMATLIADQARWFTANRVNYKSDTACERMWDTTEKGIRMSQIKWRIKDIEQLSKNITTYLRVLENQAKGVY